MCEIDGLALGGVQFAGVGAAWGGAGFFLRD